MPGHTTTGLPAAAAGTIILGGDLTVNRMGFGAMRLTGRGIWGPPADREECIRVLRRAIELGVDFIDTADSYGPAVSEEIIAEALHPYPEDLVIATKVCGPMGSGPNDKGLSRAHIMAAVEADAINIRSNHDRLEEIIDAAREARPAERGPLDVSVWCRTSAALRDPDSPERRHYAAIGVDRLILVQFDPADPAQL